MQNFSRGEFQSEFSGTLRKFVYRRRAIEKIESYFNLPLIEVFKSIDKFTHNQKMKFLTIGMECAGEVFKDEELDPTLKEVVELLHLAAAAVANAAEAPVPEGKRPT